MFVSGAREGVRRRGQTGVFLVIWVDLEQRVADLMLLTDGIYRLEENVPFTELDPLHDDLS
jgi:hypothetical protein